MQIEKLQNINEKEQGKLAISYQKWIWSCSMLAKEQFQNTKFQTKHNYVSAVFDSLGIGIEPAYKYLFEKSPSFNAFEDWIITNGNISNEMIKMFNSAFLKDEPHKNSEKIETAELNNESLRKWDEDGYVVIKNAVSKDDCVSSIKAISDLLEIDTFDNSTWYKPNPLKSGIMVQLFRHQQLNKNRLSKKIRGAFEQLWKRNDLMVSMDRVSFNPPENETFKFPGPNLHWDVSLKLPIPFGLQGLLYLSDTPENQGAFSLVPGFHKKIEAWLKSSPENVNPRDEDLFQLDVKPIGANAGDFIIWHQALPHGSSPNSGIYPRYVQYINYQPLNREIQAAWI